jgi:creatinine amidohydrolase
MSTPLAQNPRAGLDIFAETMAEMTWFEVEQAAKEGAILLWALGVIEQHGPHLPTGTDVYLPSARLRGVRAALAQRGIAALIVPPYYWGVNVVSGSFPASPNVRPEIMQELMADVFAGFARDGFRQVFCVSGHGDAAHNRTVHAGIALGRSRTGLDISFVIDSALASRIGIPLDDPCLTLTDDGKPDAARTPLVSSPSAPVTQRKFLDVHAGQWETSIMMHCCAPLVREAVRPTLKSTDYGMEDLMTWRQGYEAARRKTPLGYFGDPAAATREEGERALAASVAQAADAIARRVRARAGG